MKKQLHTCTAFIFILTVLNTSSNTYAQTYIPFPTQNVQWNCNNWSGWYNAPNDHGTETDHLTYTTGGDTMFNNLIYTQLIQRDLHYTYWIRPSSGVYQNNYFTGPNYIGAYRNDSINRKVYIIPRDSSAEEIFYDFSLNVGDTLKDWWTIFPEIYMGPNFVDSIDSVLLDGGYHKRFYIESSPMNYCYPIIEGIGSEAGILNPLNYFESGAGLECFTVNNRTIYPDTLTACDMVNAVHEIMNDNLQIFPNPSEGIFSVNSSKAVARIDIVDVPGKIVYLDFETGLNFIVNLSGYSKGIYFCRIVYNDHTFAMKKIIIR